jgi:hypothetical protein
LCQDALKQTPEVCARAALSDACGAGHHAQPGGVQILGPTRYADADRTLAGVLVWSQCNRQHEVMDCVNASFSGPRATPLAWLDRQAGCMPEVTTQFRNQSGRPWPGVSLEGQQRLACPCGVARQLQTLDHEAWLHRGGSTVLRHRMAAGTVGAMHAQPAAHGWVYGQQPDTTCSVSIGHPPES